MGSSSLVDNMARHLAALLAVLAVAACLQTTLGYEFGCGPSHVHNACREDGSSQPGGIADDCCAFEGQGSCATGYVFYEGNHGCSNGAFGGVLSTLAATRTAMSTIQRTTTTLRIMTIIT